MSKHFVFVKINGDHQPSVFKAYGVSAMPTIIFMKPDGTVISQFLGYRDLRAYLGEMNKALQMAKP